MGKHVMHTLKTCFVFILLLSLCSGCATVASRYGNTYHGNNLPILPALYSGSALDIHTIPMETGFFALLDLPLSFVVDTLILPVTTYEQFWTGRAQACAAKGKIDYFKKKIAKGKSLNKKNPKGRTALMYAAWHNQKDVAELLVKNGADMNVKDSQRGATALMYATIQGHADMVRLLLKHGAGINDKGSKIWKSHTALIMAVMNENQELVQIFLEYEADVNETDDDLETALFKAARNGNEKIVILLIKNGANINAKNRSRWTPLMVAEQKLNALQQKYPNLKKRPSKIIAEQAEREKIVEILKHPDTIHDMDQ
jgi:ankyrin repeat protein